ncbi:MAG: hypothetical protein JRC86_00400 [Deltaproteobacteria bacterium]|nr:hypothetical protein [Deltaproteobacteria bacterium]
MKYTGNPYGQAYRSPYGAPVSPLSYLLKATFDSAPNQTFSDAQVLDTPAEGVESGSLTVVDTSTGTVKIVSGELEIVGDGTYNKTGIVDSDGVSRLLGRGLFIDHIHASSNFSLIGFTNSSALSVNIQFGVGIANTVLNYWVTTPVPVGEIPTGARYSYLFLSGGFNSSGVPIKPGDTEADFLYGGRIFIKGGAFTSWTLMWLYTANNAATIHALINIAASPALFDNILIPTAPLTPGIMFPAVYQDETPDLSAHDVGDGDILFDTRVTTPGAGTDVLTMRFRLQDSQNFWSVNMVAGTAGTDLTLHKTTGGVEAAAVATADVDFAITTAYDIRIITRGDSWFRVYVDGGLELTYNVPDAAFENETEIQLVNGSGNFTPNLVAVWPSTDADIDAEITRATGVY